MRPVSFLRHYNFFFAVPYFAVDARRYGLTCSGSEVTRVELSKNNFIGTLPTQIGLLTALTSRFKVNNQNSLWGTIPTEIGMWTGLLNNAYFSRNSFTGEGVESLRDIYILVLDIEYG